MHGSQNANVPVKELQHEPDRLEATPVPEVTSTFSSVFVPSPTTTFRTDIELGASSTFHTDVELGRLSTFAD